MPEYVWVRFKATTDIGGRVMNEGETFRVYRSALTGNYILRERGDADWLFHPDWVEEVPDPAIPTSDFTHP